MNFYRYNHFEKNSFYLPQTGRITNEKGGLKILMYHDKCKALRKVKVKLKNYLNNHKNGKASRNVNVRLENSLNS